MYSLNPYYTGIYSTRKTYFFMATTANASLNPYYTGIYSTRGDFKPVKIEDFMVLILIILEYTLREFKVKRNRLSRKRLNPYYTGIYSTRQTTEDYEQGKKKESLNPYYTGIYSTRCI